MQNTTDLSPQAAEDLGHIAAELQEYVCLECGHLNPSQAEICAACGTSMSIPWGTVSDGYITALDLVRGGQLTPDQLGELLNSLHKVQSFYTAGTRYSVFG